MIVYTPQLNIFGGPACLALLKNTVFGLRAVVWNNSSGRLRLFVLRTFDSYPSVASCGRGVGLSVNLFRWTGG